MVTHIDPQPNKLQSTVFKNILITLKRSRVQSKIVNGVQVIFSNKFEILHDESFRQKGM